MARSGRSPPAAATRLGSMLAGFVFSSSASGTNVAGPLPWPATLMCSTASGCHPFVRSSCQKSVSASMPRSYSSRTAAKGTRSVTRTIASYQPPPS